MTEPVGTPVIESELDPVADLKDDAAIISPSDNELAGGNGKTVIGENTIPLYVASAESRGIALFSRWMDCERYISSEPEATYQRYGNPEEAIRAVCVTFGMRNPFTAFRAVETGSKKRNRPEPSAPGAKRVGLTTIPGSDLPEPVDPTEGGFVDVSKHYGGLSTTLHDGRIYTGLCTPVYYTDGACSSNGVSGMARSGCGVYAGGDVQISRRDPVSRDSARATNNFAELGAILLALKFARGNGEDKIQIRSDSQFAISCITDWSLKWRRKSRNGKWRNGRGKPIIHQEVVEKILALHEVVKVDYIHVRGHSGEDKGSDMADMLAVEGAGKAFETTIHD